MLSMNRISKLAWKYRKAHGGEDIVKIGVVRGSGLHHSRSGMCHFASTCGKDTKDAAGVSSMKH